SPCGRINAGTRLVTGPRLLCKASGSSSKREDATGQARGIWLLLWFEADAFPELCSFEQSSLGYNEPYSADVTDVLEWIRVQNNNVRTFARFNGSNFIFQLHSARGCQRRSLYCFQRRQTCLDV